MRINCMLLALILYNAFGFSQQTYSRTTVRGFSISAGQTTTHIHSLPDSIQIIGNVVIRLGLKGDFGSSSEYADLFLDDETIGTHNGGEECQTSWDYQSWTVPAGQFVSHIIDSEVAVEVRNSSSVNYCSTRYHAVKITFSYNELTPAEVGQKSVVDFPEGGGQLTQHSFLSNYSIDRSGSIDVGIRGDFNSTSEYAEIWIEGDLIGQHDGGSNCAASFDQASFSLSRAALQDYASDGIIDVMIWNSSNANLCQGEHEVFLNAGSIPFWMPCSDCGYSGPYNRGWLVQGHLGQDYPAYPNDSVRAVADGRVYKVEKNFPGFGGLDLPGPVMVIEHIKEDGSHFFAIYGHVSTTLEKDDIVRGNDIIGTVGHYYVDGEDWSHLHFGVWDAPDSFPTTGWGYGSIRDFTDPTPFLNSRYLPWP